MQSSDFNVNDREDSEASGENDEQAHVTDTVSDDMVVFLRLEQELRVHPYSLCCIHEKGSTETQRVPWLDSMRNWEYCTLYQLLYPSEAITEEQDILIIESVVVS
jgi:hypothetical protein